MVALVGACSVLAACGSSKSSGSGGGGGASGGTIPVTFVGDQTGEVAYVGKQVLNGMQIALKQVNGSGELKGKKIVLTVKDTGSQQSNATTLTSQAVRSSAVAIFGPALSNEALATAPIAEAAKVVDIFTLAQSTGLVEIGKYIYRVTPSEERYDVLIPDHLAKLGIKSANLIYASDNPTLAQETKQSMRGWMGKLGIHVGTMIGVPSTTTDFSSIATRLQSGNPQAIGIMLVGTGISSLVKALRDNGYKGQLFADQAATAGTLKPAGPAANGLLYAVQYHPAFSYPLSKRFAKAFAQAHPGVAPTGYAATGYDAVQALAQALAKSGSATREGVLRGMQELAGSATFPSASGPLRFVAPDHRDVTAGGALVQWRNGDEHLVLRGQPGLASQPVAPR